MIRRRRMSKEQEQCSICNCPFDLEKEGGVTGFFGIRPVTFCPDCKVGIWDMVDQQTPWEEEDE